jgi:hypothetical protein
MLSVLILPNFYIVNFIESAIVTIYSTPVSLNIFFVEYELFKSKIFFIYQN